MSGSDHSAGAALTTAEHSPGFSQIAVEDFRITEEPFYLPIADEVELFLAAYEQKVPVLLKGPTGVGKTRFIEYMSWRLHQHLGQPSEEGVPLITVLFMAAVMLPLFLPDGMTLDKLLRALIGVSLFAGAYMAEVVRGGLQAIPRGQYEAAAALGLGYWRTMGFVILPQALRHVIPGLINTVIALFKDTTLVLIIGMFDFLGIIQAALTDPDWLGFALEGYVFAALVYWVICFSLSRLSLAVERRAPGYRAPIAGAMT
mgnify:CR=1 FL=1